MIVDGKAIAAGVLARAKARAAKLPHPPRVLAIVARETPATRSYLSIKEKQAAAAGCAFHVERFPESVSLAELHLAISSTEADAIIVQLPLPENLRMQSVCDAIPLEKDADVLSAAARARFEAGEKSALAPPVALALAEILKAGGVDPRGKKAVVIGSGWLVGQPCLAWLARAGAHALALHHESDFYRSLTSVKEAEVVVAGMGVPHIIKPQMLKDGCVLVDAGTSESSGKLAGDADPACAEKCALFTPVPGGVGPVAVAKLFENAVALAELREKS